MAPSSLALLQRPIDQKRQYRHAAGERCLDSLLTTRCDLGWVLPGRQRHDAHLEALLLGKAHAAQRSILSSLIGVEGQDEGGCQPA